jgi:hypothetical protein
MSVRLVPVFVLLFAVIPVSFAGCLGSGGSPASASPDPVLGDWVQNGEPVLLMTLEPSGTALLRFRMPGAENTPEYADSSGSWKHTGPDRVTVTYTGPGTGEIRMLNLVLSDENRMYVDMVTDANGTIISPERELSEKLTLVRAGTSSAKEPLAIMEIAGR